jgi:ABC-2 type transport system permease protein
MNFLMMPMFFLSGALFPLAGLPGWMTFLTRIDPAAYGIDPLRRVLLEGAGMPPAALDRMSLTIGGTVVPIVAEAGILLAFGIVVLAIAVRNFRVRD